MDVDLSIHRGEGDTPIFELPKDAGVRVNLADVMDVSAFNALERAVDRSIITKKSFLLELANRLFEIPQIEDGLRRLDVSPKEFKAKLDALMEEPRAQGVAGPAAPENYLAMVEPLSTHAFVSAVSAGHDFIQPADLFRRSPRWGTNVSTGSSRSSI